MKTKFNALYEAFVNEVDLPDNIANWIINSLKFYVGKNQNSRRIKMPQDYSKDELVYLRDEVYPEFGHLTVLSKADKNKIYLRMKQRFDPEYRKNKSISTKQNYDKKQATINLGFNDIKGRKEYITSRMLHKAKKRANNSNPPKEFNITVEDVLNVWPKDNKCPIFGIVLEKGNKIALPNSPSLDRVDSKKGYTPDNIAVMSYKANILKNDGTWQELKRIIDYINGKI
jgi:hypothetical protein